MPKRDEKYMQAQRARLLDGALKSIAKKGLLATSMRDIAHAGRASIGALYVHFKSKEEILQAILEREWQQWGDLVELPLEPYLSAITAVLGRRPDAKSQAVSRAIMQLGLETTQSSPWRKSLLEVARVSQALVDSKLRATPRLKHLTKNQRLTLYKQMLILWAGLEWYRVCGLSIVSHKDAPMMGELIDLMIDRAAKTRDRTTQEE